MDISPALYEVTIYIHPDEGPIKPMTLNMLEIQKDVLGLDTSSNRDKVRIDQTIKRIKAAFPGVNPYGNLDMITHFVRRLSHVALFSGVVLRLPGIIQEDAQVLPADADYVTSLEKKQTSLESEIDQLRAKIQDLETGNNEKAEENLIMVAQGEQYVKTFAELDRRIKLLQEDLSNASDERDRAVAEARRSKDRETMLEQENAALQVKDEQAQRDRRNYIAMVNEVGELRMEKVNLSDANDKLRASLEKCKQEKISLQEQLQRKVEQQLPDPAKPDQARKDWIDR